VSTATVAVRGLCQSYWCSRWRSCWA